MATILRTWAFRYLWFYNLVSKTTSLLVGGEQRFRTLALQGLLANPGKRALDLCCGSGLASQVLSEEGYDLIGLDCSPIAIRTAQAAVPSGKFVLGRAEKLPLEANQFDLVHTSMALHEMTPAQVQKIYGEVYRVLKPGGIFTFIDFHKPSMPLLWPALALFLWLFETETSWQWIEQKPVALLPQQGFAVRKMQLHAGGSLQVIQAQKL
ncbi:MAG: methyltransferase domain-containing protein [Gloeobacterales cyanobacterium]